MAIFSALTALREALQRLTRLINQGADLLEQQLPQGEEEPRQIANGRRTK